MLGIHEVQHQMADVLTIENEDQSMESDSVRAGRAVVVKAYRSTHMASRLSARVEPRGWTGATELWDEDPSCILTTGRFLSVKRSFSLMTPFK